MDKILRNDASGAVSAGSSPRSEPKATGYLAYPDPGQGISTPYGGEHDTAADYLSEGIVVLQVVLAGAATEGVAGEHPDIYELHMRLLSQA